MDWTGHIIEVDEESLRRREGEAAYQRLLDDLNWGTYMKKRVMEAEARQEIAALEKVPLITNEGNFRLRSVIPGQSFHEWVQQKGLGLWDQNDFIREYERDNPWCRVRQKMANATIVVPERWKSSTGRQDGDPTEETGTRRAA